MSLLLALIGGEEPQPPVEATFSAEIDLSRKWYVRRGKKIHLFRSGSDADAFIEAQEQADKAIAEAQKTSRRARKRLRERVYSANPVQPIESVDIDQLGDLVDRYQMAIDLPKLIVQQDFDRVMQIMAQAMQMQEDDDVEILLLC